MDNLKCILWWYFVHFVDNLQFLFTLHKTGGESLHRLPAFILFIDFVSSEDSSNCKNLSVICFSYDNTGLGGRCVNDLSISDIDAYMT